MNFNDIARLKKKKKLKIMMSHRCQNNYENKVNDTGKWVRKNQINQPDINKKRI